jgi:hypothetical protein
MAVDRVAIKPKGLFVEGGWFMGAIRKFEAELSERRWIERLQDVRNIEGGKS